MGGQSGEEMSDVPAVLGDMLERFLRHLGRDVVALGFFVKKISDFGIREYNLCIHGFRG